MTKNEMINEMLEFSCTYRHDGICEVSQRYCMDTPCNGYKNMEKLFDAGYRKASEVVREIFEEIEEEIEAAIESNYRAKKDHENHSVIPNYDNFNAMCDGKIYAMRGLLDFMEELKKKYMENKGE